MTISTTTTFDEASGTGVALAFPFTFAAQDAAMVKVYFDGVLQGSGYSVALNSNQLSSPGGTVTFLTAPNVGVAVRVERDTPLTQPLALAPYGVFSAVSLEEALDRKTLALQDVNGRVVGAVDTADAAAATAGAAAATAASAVTTTGLLATDLAAEAATRASAIQAIIDAGVQVGVSGASFVQATGTSTSRTLADRFADEVNVADFGCIPTETAAVQTAALQAAIDYCRTNSYQNLYLPDSGYTINDSINLTGFYNKGFRVYGTGGGLGGSVINATCYGKILFECQGSADITFEHITVHANEGIDPNGILTPDKSKAPIAAFLLSRIHGGSAGWHHFTGVKVQGTFTEACILSFASEVNVYEKCQFINTCPGRYAFYCANNNTDLLRDDGVTLGVTPTFTAIPDTNTGGNTVHSFNACMFIADVYPTTFNDRTRGAAMNLTGIRSGNIDGCYFYGGGMADIVLEGGWFTMSGSESEGTGTYGIRIVGNGLHQSAIYGWGGSGIYADDGASVEDCEFHGEFDFHLSPGGGVPTSPPGYVGLGFDTLKNSSIRAKSNVQVEVRTLSENNQFWSFAEGYITLPADQQGSSYPVRLTGGDGRRRFYQHINTGTKDRLVTHALKTVRHHHTVQRPAYAATLAPAQESGDVVSMTLTGSIIINEIDYGDWNPGVSGEALDGQLLTFVFKQDATGDRYVTFGASYKTNWTPDRAPNKVNTITFMQVSGIGWVQLSAATGL